MISKTTLALAALATTLAVAPAAANTGDCAAIDANAARGLFDKWAATLPGHNADLVLSFYAPGHSFKPHDAEAPLADAKAIRDYWTKFVDETPTAALKDVAVEGDCNAITKTGVKTLTVDGAPVEAEFTMAMENRDGVWLITRHEINPAN